MVWHLGSILQPGIEPMCSAVEMWDLWTSRKVPVCVFLCHQAIQSVQFSRSVVSDSLRPHELQHARPPCPSPTLGVYSNSCPSSRWCHPAISSSVVPFSSCPQSLPASGTFPVSELFAWGGPINSIQFPSDTDWASSSSAQFWCCPSGGGTRSHRGRAQTCKTEPAFHVRSSHNPNHRSSPSTGSPLWFWPTGCGLERPVLLSGVVNLLEWLTELRETLSSFLQKDVIQEWKKEKLRARSVGRSLELRCPLWVYLRLPAPHLFANQDVLWTLFFRGFMEVSLHRQE